MPFLIEEYGYSRGDLGEALAAVSIAYGLSKFLMGSVSDRSNSRYFLAAGLVMSALVMLIGLYALELAPKKAVGTAAGLTGLFGYLGGAVAANALLGYTVDHFGWDGGFLMLTISCGLSIVFFTLAMLGENKVHAQRKLDRETEELVPAAV